MTSNRVVRPVYGKGEGKEAHLAMRDGVVDESLEQILERKHFPLPKHVSRRRPKYRIGRNYSESTYCQGLECRPRSLDSFPGTLYQQALNYNLAVSTPNLTGDIEL